MAIVNGYLTLAEVKAYLKISDTADDTELELAVEAASRAIDDHCKRFFYDTGSATAKTFLATDPYTLVVPDFHTTTGLVVKTDTSGDGTFDTTWAATDYQVEPLDPDPGFPWTRIVAIGDHLFPTCGRQASTQITAQWGWAAVPKQVKQACAVEAPTFFKRATEGAAPIITIDGVTLQSSMFLDGQATLLLKRHRRDVVGMA